MHSANFTALSRAVSSLLAPLLVLLALRVLLAVPELLAVPVPVLPFSAEPFEQPAPISATVARAASGRRVLLMVAPWCVGIGLTPVLCRSALITAASLDRALGRRTWQCSRDRRRPGATRSARARCRRSGTGHTWRRARTATRRHRRARCRPRPPTREQTCWGWPPSGQLPLLSRTSGPPHGRVAPGRPGSASRCRRRTRPRCLRHRLQPGAGH